MGYLREDILKVLMKENSLVSFEKKSTELIITFTELIITFNILLAEKKEKYYYFLYKNKESQSMENIDSPEGANNDGGWQVVENRRKKRTTNPILHQGRIWSSSAPAGQRPFQKSDSRAVGSSFAPKASQSSAPSSRHSYSPVSAARFSNPRVQGKGFYKNESRGTQRSDPRLISYNKRITEAARKWDISSCNKILDEIHQARLYPNPFTFNPIINLYVKRRDEKKAFGVFEQMQEAGVRPNEVTFTSLINLYVKKGDEKKAFAVFEQMQEAGVRPKKGVRPDIRTFYVYIYPII